MTARARRVRSGLPASLGFHPFCYGFTGPNLALKPEFAVSYEYGGDFTFLNNRLGLDITTYRKQTRDQIVNDIRGSYGTGFILFNLNGAETRNEGIELTLRGTPVLTQNLSWDVQANFDNARGKVLALPNALPESTSRSLRPQRLAFTRRSRARSTCGQGKLHPLACRSATPVSWMPVTTGPPTTRSASRTRCASRR
jgi:outer membrane receptor protein involved in Fe transport